MSLIGICGPARSGKDTLADLMVSIFKENQVNAYKTSFAKQLKLECADFVKNTIGIDIFTEDTAEKEIIRPLLVTWGTHVRRKLDPNVWIKSVESSLKKDHVCIVADVRFKNEFDWIRENNGYCVFVDRILPDGTIIPPANDDEKENNTFLRDNSDYQLVWNTINDEQRDWLSAVAFEVLNKTVPTKTLESWIQTYHS